jgi:hypothetical protein
MMERREGGLSFPVGAVFCTSVPTASSTPFTVPESSFSEFSPWSTSAPSVSFDMMPFWEFLPTKAKSEVMRRIVASKAAGALFSGGVSASRIVLTPAILAPLSADFAVEAMSVVLQGAEPVPSIIALRYSLLLQCCPTPVRKKSSRRPPRDRLYSSLFLPSRDNKPGVISTVTMKMLVGYLT